MAVYTDINKSDLENIFANYDIGKPIEILPISNGINNSNYKVITSNGNYLLTIIEDGSISSSDINFITNLITELSKADIPTPKPVLNKEGCQVIEFAGKPLIITSFLEGGHIRNVKEFTATDKIGDILAKIHLASANIDMNRKNPMAITDMISNIDKYLEQANNFKQNCKKDIIKTANNILENWPEDLPMGIIHADLFPDNILFNPDKTKITGVLDFYLSGRDFFAYDLAICINAWCFSCDNSNIKKAKLMLDAYQKHRHLQKAEIDNFQILMQAASLRFLLSRMYEWFNKPKDALVTPHNPQEYIDKLEYHKQHNIIGELI